MRIIDQSFAILYPFTKEEAVKELKAIEYACRMCYASTDKMTDDSYDRFIRARIKQDHTAPLEFGSMTVELTVGRDVLAEITRHRLASFCVTSQRYINYSKEGGIEFIKPTFYARYQDLYKEFPKDQWTITRIWEQQMYDAERYYRMMIDEYNCKPEEARTVLPNSTACTLVMKANLREWRQIFKLRTSKAAYPPMRDIMTRLLKTADDLMPCVFDDLVKEMEAN